MEGLLLFSFSFVTIISSVCSSRRPGILLLLSLLVFIQFSLLPDPSGVGIHVFAGRLQGLLKSEQVAFARVPDKRPN